MDKDLNYRLTADDSRMSRGFKSAEQSARVFERELARLEAQQRRVHGAMEEVGRGMLVFGAAIAAGLALAVKAAIQWETAWTGVTKVVDGTPAQMAALEEEIRNLALILPQSATEIAGVAAAAGQLGIARQDITDFTHVMVDLGVATNLTSEEAAFALARLMNIMQTAPEDVRRLGSAIVALGNTSATTEQEIVAMALRIAGAGNIIGLSEANVLGFATALSSVGIEAEAGGTAISTIFIKIENAVRGGGKQLQAFAQVAGQSSADFSRAYQQDAASAIATFVAGLGRIASSGGDVFATLEQLGITEIRQRDAMLRLAGAGDVLTKSLQTSNTGWAENTALAEEAERRYGTVESRMQLARNAIVDLAIDLGQVLLPAVGKSADTIGAMVDIVNGLPGPLKTAAVIIATLAAGLALVGGAALIAIPRIAAVKTALDTLAVSEGRAAAMTVATAGALGRVGSVLSGGWGLAIAGAIAAISMYAASQAKARREVEEYLDTLDKQTGALTRDTRVKAFAELQDRGLADAAQRLGINLADVTDAVLGEADAIARVNTILDENLDKEIAGKDARDKATGQRIRAAMDIKAALQQESEELANSRQKWQQQNEALGTANEAAKQVEPSTRRLGETLGVTGQQAEDAADAVDSLAKELDALFGSLFNVEEAEDAVAEAFARLKQRVDEAREAGDKNARSLDGQSQTARDNREAVRGLIQTYFAQIEALASSGASSDELRAKTEQLKQQFIAQMRQAGFSEAAIRRYAASFDEVPGVVTSTIKADITQAQKNVWTIQRQIKGINDKTVTVTVRYVETPRGYHVSGPGGSGTLVRDRWGGVHEHAQMGLLRDAAIYSARSPARYAYAEPATQGEAFIPKVGNLAQSRDIWEYVGRNWLGVRGQVQSGVHIDQLVVKAYSDRFSIAQVMQDLAMHGVH